VERPLQERLVGAAVLIAMAIIVIPELLSGPGADRADAVGRDRAGEVALKTYTIDLSNPGGTMVSAAPADPPPLSEPATPPEDRRAIDTKPAVAAPSEAAAAATQPDPTPAAATVEQPPPVAKPAAPQPAPATGSATIPQAPFSTP
jgi:DedD protein